MAAKSSPDRTGQEYSILLKITESLSKTASLRNILVHEYGKIDRKLIYKILKERIEELENFKKQITLFIKK